MDISRIALDPQVRVASYFPYESTDPLYPGLVHAAIIDNTLFCSQAYADALQQYMGPVLRWWDDDLTEHSGAGCPGWITAHIREEVWFNKRIVLKKPILVFSDDDVTTIRDLAPFAKSVGRVGLWDITDLTVEEFSQEAAKFKAAKGA